MQEPSGRRSSGPGPASLHGRLVGSRATRGCGPTARSGRSAGSRLLRSDGDGEPLAALRAPTLDDGSASGRLHAAPEAVPALAPDSARLISTLHWVPRGRTGGRTGDGTEGGTEGFSAQEASRNFAGNHQGIGARQAGPGVRRGESIRGFSALSTGVWRFDSRPPHCQGRRLGASRGARAADESGLLRPVSRARPLDASSLADTSTSRTDARQRLIPQPTRAPTKA